MAYQIRPLEAAVVLCLGVPAEELVLCGRLALKRAAVQPLMGWCGLTHREATRLVDELWPFVVAKAQGLTWDQQVKWTQALEGVRTRAGLLRAA